MQPVELPPDHPARAVLAEEVHARPPAPVSSPAAISSLALVGAPAEQSYTCLRELAAAARTQLPATGPAHVIAELDGVRVKWERHGEFVRFTFVRPLAEASLEALTEFPTALTAVPAEWLAGLPGQTIAAVDVALLAARCDPSELELVARWFARDALAGAVVLDGAAQVFTDFVLRDGGGATAGRTRWLALDSGMGPAQSARLVQRLFEIETYRMLALLALPLARDALPALEQIEGRLAEITSDTASLQGDAGAAETHRAERRLLDELTRIASEVESSVARTAFRFSAGQAYWELVRSRVSELREQRIGDMRTVGGFLSRRLAPAMSSVQAAARRQEELSARIERASTLLRTRVDIALEEQNQKLLTAMDRRSQTSLRIQQAVEGLSVAAITYYGATLVGDLVKPLKHVWHGLDTEWIVAGAIPVIALLSWQILERVRRGIDV